MSAESAAPGSFHGRRKGKALRPGQDRVVREALPTLRLPEGAIGAPLSGLFPVPVSAVDLEIGFGGGEHLADALRHEPGIGFIGCEPFVNGMAKLLAVAEAQRLQNLRLWDDDAADLLTRLPVASLRRIYLLFPDPWPKRRQRKRRFLSDSRLTDFARVLVPGGEFRFATDIDDYAGWVLARVLRSTSFSWAPSGPDDWRRPWPGWQGTRYEGKALREGRPSSYLTFIRS